MSTRKTPAKPTKSRSASNPAVKRFQIRSLLTRPASLLGWERLDSVLLVALTTKEPLLLDETRGSVRYIATPMAIWHTEVVFVDELDLARPEVISAVSRKRIRPKLVNYRPALADAPLRVLPMKMEREECLHDFHTGFVPTTNREDDYIIVTRNSPLISCMSRQRPGQYRIEGGSFIGRGASHDATPEEAAEYLARSPHWAHLMRLTLELGWHDVHRALGKL